MDTPAPQEFTQLLLAWSQGDQAALDQLMPMIYAELHRLAHHYLRHERAGHTLQTTALVNEAYVRLIDASRVEWQNRAHFFAVAAQMMRRVLVDFARERGRQKRGGGAVQVSLDESLMVTRERLTEMLALDEALERLAKDYPRESRVVEMRFFGGLEGREMAAVLGVSQATVTEDWNFARLWLRRALSGE